MPERQKDRTFLKKIEKVFEWQKDRTFLKELEDENGVIVARLRRVVRLSRRIRWRSVLMRLLALGALILLLLNAAVLLLGTTGFLCGPPDWFDQRACSHDHGPPLAVITGLSALTLILLGTLETVRKSTSASIQEFSEEVEDLTSAPQDDGSQNPTGPDKVPIHQAGVAPASAGQSPAPSTQFTSATLGDHTGKEQGNQDHPGPPLASPATATTGASGDPTDIARIKRILSRARYRTWGLTTAADLPLAGRRRGAVLYALASLTTVGLAVLFSVTW